MIRVSLLKRFEVRDFTRALSPVRSSLRCRTILSRCAFQGRENVEELLQLTNWWSSYARS